LSLFRAKLASDMGDSFFLQALLHEFILKGHFTKHVRRMVKEYRLRRDALCGTLRQHLPEGCRFRVPQGGLSVWVELPPGMNSLPLLELAREAGVEFAPAIFCMPDRSDAPALRLSFSRANPDEIVVGVKALCSVIADCIETPGLLAARTTGYQELFQ
jgi:2-aminoadipate transaminase